MEQAMADIQPELDKRFKVPLWVPIIYGLCRAVWLLAQENIRRKEVEQ